MSDTVTEFDTEQFDLRNTEIHVSHTSHGPIARIERGTEIEYAFLAPTTLTTLAKIVGGGEGER